MVRTLIALAAFCVAPALADDALPLKYTAFLGGQASIASVAVDSAGSAYITGSASGPLPVTPGAFQTEYKPGTCTEVLLNTPGPPRTFPCEVAFAGKLNREGTALTYLTYLGTSHSRGSRVAVDAEGNTWIAGVVFSSDLPVSQGALQSRLTGSANAFAMELNPTGSRVLFATYLGGSGSEEPTGVALDGNGNLHIAGSTTSSDFPVTPNAFQTDPLPYSAFVTKFDAAGRLIYSTYFHGGASSSTSAGAIAADSTGAAYITGTHRGASLLVTPGAFETTAHGSDSAFVAKLDASGSKLVYATYLAGNGEEDGVAISVDRQGNAVVAGEIRATMPNLPSSFPTTPGAFQTTAPNRAIQANAPLAFVAKLNAAGSALIYSTLLYASDSVGIADLKVDPAGNAFVTGNTYALDLPTTPGALRQCSPNGASWGSVGFFMKLSGDGSRPTYSTYLGRGASSVIAIDPAGDAYVAGNALGNFPLIPGSFGWNGSGAYVLKLSPAPLPAGSVSCIAHAASRAATAIAPGEIVDIFGFGIGPRQPVSATVESGRIATALAGVQVLFNGIAAPVLYAAPDRIRAIVPFAVGSLSASDFSSATVQILSSAAAVQPIVVSTAPVAPGIFTVDGSSTGQALVINEDGTINSEKNPARQGSIVTMYATGLNQTQPALTDGEIAIGAASLMLPIQLSAPTSIKVDDAPAGAPEITYAGAAPGFAAGLTQINFRVPVTIFHGFTPFGIYLGSYTSQTGVYFYMQ